MEGALLVLGVERRLYCQVRQDDRDGWNGELETRKRPPYIPIPPAVESHAPIYDIYCGNYCGLLRRLWLRLRNCDYYASYLLFQV